MTADVVELSPSGGNRPFAVIDSGWQSSIGLHAAAGGPWREPNRLFPPMAKLSDEIRSMGARPGIWVRPLVTVDRVPGVVDPSRLALQGRLPRRRPRPEPARGAGPRARGRGAGGPRVAIRPREARLHDLRPLRPLGLRDGPERDGRRLVVRRPQPHLGRDRARPLRRHTRGRRPVRGHRLQHDRPPRGRPLRAAAHRRRHERPRVGAHAQDGRQHDGLPPAAARHLLRRRRRLRADHEVAAVAAGRAVAAPRGRERDAPVPLAHARGPGPGAEGRGARGVRPRGRRPAAGRAARLAGDDLPAAMASRRAGRSTSSGPARAVSRSPEMSSRQEDCTQWRPLDTALPAP